MVQGLNGLRLDAVIRSHHQDGNIGHLGSARTHRREGLMSGCIDECDSAIIVFDMGVDLVGTDVLGDATGLARDDVGLADCIKELRLAVVDVAHDGHHRRPRREILLTTLIFTEVEGEGLEQLAIFVLRGYDLDVKVQFPTQQLQRVVID